MKHGLLYGFIFICIGSIFGQTTNITGTIEWRKMEINASVKINLANEGIYLPVGRIHAEETISDQYPHLMRPHLLSLPVDSSTTLIDLLNRGEISLLGTDTISLTAKKRAPALSTDLKVMSANYTLNLGNLSASLILHSRPRETIRTLTPAPVASYTGIIIIAYELLPIHGRNTRAMVLPCLFPKIWDTDMNLIYERNMVDPQTVKTIIRYVDPESIFTQTPSGLDEDLAKFVGSNPLRIIARGVFGLRPTDPIIDKDDALLIISSERNRMLLREGKVAIVLNRSVLTNTF